MSDQILITTCRVLSERKDNLFALSVLFFKYMYSHSLPRSVELRTKIDHLRIERARYDLLYKKLDKTLTELRRDNALLMESATAAFNIRRV